MKYYQDNFVTIYHGDCIEQMRLMESQSVNCCVTSPPYFGLRDYGCEGQIGLEETPEAYVSKLVEVFSEVKRVLRDDGTLWLNLGDSYAGSGKGRNGDGSSNVSPDSKQATSLGTTIGTLVKSITPYCKPKDLIGIPWRVAFALQADGWYLRQDIIWHKTNPMPESVTDRCTKAHEYIFLLSKSPKYYFDNAAIKEKSSTYGSEKLRDKSKEKYGNAYGSVNEPISSGNRLWTQEYSNKRSVWTVTTKPYNEAHFATFPPDLITPCILAGCPEDGVVLDPFGGSGTTAMVSRNHGRKAVMCELNEKYIEMQMKRIAQRMLL